MTNHNDSISLAEKLKRESVNLSEHPATSWRRMIRKVHPSLRTTNEKDEPFFVSIGPYHHGRQHLQAMETYKVRMLQLLLDDRTEDTVENYIAAMTEIEDEARSFYASDIEMNPDKFVEMMILDGCFIIEFLRKVQGIIRHRSVFDAILLLPDIFRDLSLYENQLPLFVLSELFELTKGENENFADSIGELVHYLCFQYVGEIEKPKVDRAEIEQSPHLLDLVYMTCKNSIFMKQEQPHVIDLLYLEKYFEKDAKTSEKEKRIGFHFIKSATTLEETGVVFKKAERAGAKLCDITFNEKGVLEIPQLMISDRSESLFRNLAAYEQYIREYDFTDYLVFMDYLINSPKDVELLRQRGIIVNMLGDDEYVSNMFNKFCSFVVTKISTSKFVDLCTRINNFTVGSAHVGSRRRNVWMAKLWREYFNSPWTLISFLAALLLLGLTIVQTIFSIISYTNPK